MPDRLYVSGISVAALIVVATIVGCGRTDAPSQSPSTVASTPKHHAADSRKTNWPGEGANREPNHAGDEQHLAASGKVFDIMIAEMDPNAIQKLARLLPNSTQKEQQAFAEQMSRVFRSLEFRRDYCTVLMELFSTEECERLSEILTDPVMRKFQQRRGDYITRMFAMAEKYIEADDSVR